MLSRVSDEMELVPGQDCPANHSKLVVFDAKAAKGLTPAEIRKRWPRIQCSTCNTLLYASQEHMLAGDW